MILQTLDLVAAQAGNLADLVGVIATLLHAGGGLCETLVGSRLNNDHFVLFPLVPVARGL